MVMISDELKAFMAKDDYDAYGPPHPDTIRVVIVDDVFEGVQRNGGHLLDSVIDKLIALRDEHSKTHTNLFLNTCAEYDNPTGQLSGDRIETVEEFAKRIKRTQERLDWHNRTKADEKKEQRRLEEQERKEFDRLSKKFVGLSADAVKHLAKGK